MKKEDGNSVILLSLFPIKFLGAKKKKKKRYESIESIKKTKDSQVQAL